MITEAQEVRRHYELLNKLPKQRLSSEAVMLAYHSDAGVPISMAEEALFESRVIDSVMPILVTRSQELGPQIYRDTMMIAHQMREALGNIREHGIIDLNGQG